MTTRILQLYSADPRGVIGARLCPLPDVKTATVRREINGEYSLSFSLPRGAMYEDEIQLGRAVKATVNEAGKEQYFIIKRRTRSLIGDMQIYAEHQSYYYNSVLVPASMSTGDIGLDMLFVSLRAVAVPRIWDLSEWTYSRYSGMRTSYPEISTPISLMDALKKLLIETSGGELDFDGFDLEYVNMLGRDNGAVYRYGINLTEMESEDILDGYTNGLYPYWGKLGDASKPYTTLNEGVGIWYFNNHGVQWPISCFVPYDLNKLFETQPTQAQIKAACAAYEDKYGVNGIPFSVKASRVRIEGDVPVDLGDDVHLINAPWGVDVITRIFAMTFDALQGRVVDVEFGTVNPGFAGVVKNMK